MTRPYNDLELARLKKSLVEIKKVESDLGEIKMLIYGIDSYNDSIFKIDAMIELCNKYTIAIHDDARRFCQ